MAEESTRTWLWRAVLQGVFFALLVSGVGVVVSARVTEAIAPPTCADTKDLVRVEPVATAATSEHAPEQDSKGRVLTYTPDRLLDGDTATGWAEGAPDLGLGQALTFDFGRPVSLTLLCVVNGYAQSWPLYTKNARVRALAVTGLAEDEAFGTSTRSASAPASTTETESTETPNTDSLTAESLTAATLTTATLTTESGSTTRYATLSDAGTPEHVAVFQSVSVDLPPVRRLAIRIDSVYSGTTVGRLADTSLSEIEFWAAP